MELIIKGKNLEITDWLYDYVEKKVRRLDRYLPEIEEARVELSVENTRSAKDRQRAQLTLRRKGVILRSEERSADMFNSVDAVLNKMQRQIDRYKGKHWGRKVARESEPVEMAGEEAEPRIVRTKRFSMLPMISEEAIEQMELLGHDFFVFFDAEGGEVNVLYRREDGDYGLLQPELA